MFDWPRFLSAHAIPFVTRGPNTARGHVSCKCPMCGASDPSQHMGISLDGKGWGCLRNKGHRGKSRARLIQALLGCSSAEAARLAGYEEASPTPVDEDLAERISGLLGVEREQTEVRPPLKFPHESKPLELHPCAHPTTRSAAFWGYLADRGYTVPQQVWAAKHYGLRYATRGVYRYRIIIPVYNTAGELATWTARSIVDDEPIRYKTLPSSPKEGYEGPVALQPPGRLLLGLPLLQRCANGRVLVLCEGPFDAIRVTTLGHERGIYGTCLFGLNITDDQVLLLENLMGRFQRLVLLLDPDAALLRLRIRDYMGNLPVRFGELPAGIEDPGALTTSAVRPLFESWLS